ncbi:MAG: hypothetical protein EAS48_05515 [Chryseobacterium sp.]|nr:MAG: hypothetical protein EAS48_05515 [Chryseobacterium sp.]
MRKTAIALVFLSGLAYSQVGINTNSPQSTLDIRGANHMGPVTATDGVLVPRVNSLTTNGSADGQLVYLVADQGSRLQGFHYWNATTNQWVHAGLESGDLTDDAWVDDNANSMVKLATLSNGTTARTDATNVVIKNDGKMGVGNIAPRTKLDARTNPGNANPGEGAIGIGTTAQTAAAAGAGAVRYNTTTKQLELSNGTTWQVLDKINYTKAVVVAKKNSVGTTGNSYNYNTQTNVTGWNVELADTTNSFTSDGVFTAPRTGQYDVSFSFNFTGSAITDNGFAEALILRNGNVIRRGITSFPKGGNSQAGAAVNFVVTLNQGDTLRPAIFQKLRRTGLVFDTGDAKTLRLGNNNADDGFVNISIVEH